MALFDFLAPQPSNRTFKQQRALGDQALALAQQNAATQTQNRAEAREDVETGIARGEVPLTQATNLFDPLMGQKQGVYDLYLDSLGVNGQGGYDRALGAYQQGPGYQFALDQANQNVLRNNAALGGLASGNTLMGLSDRAQQLQNLEFGNWQNRLKGEDPTGLYQNKATALSNLGNFFGTQYNNLANAGLAGGGLQQGAAGMTMGQFNNNSSLLGQQESMRLAAQQQGIANAIGIGSAIGGFFGA